MVKQINSVMNNGAASHANVTPPTAPPAPSSNSTVATNTETPSNDGLSWQFFGYSHANVHEDMKDQIVLDSGSSADLFCNPKMVQNIKRGNSPLRLLTNGGSISSHQEGHLPGYGMVPFHAKAVTNIMSLGKLVDKYRVTYDSAQEDAFYVHTPERTVRFGRNESNLYTHTPQSLGVSSQATNKTVQRSLVQTVAENMKFYTPREIKRAKAARDLLAGVGFPTTRDLKVALSTNAIANVPVRTTDVDLAEKIFGPDLGTLKGKTTRQKPLPQITDQIAIPEELYNARSEIELAIDIFFVNGMPHLATVSKALFYRTAQFLPTRTTPDLYKFLDNALKIYNDNGFTITKIHADNEFRKILEPIEEDLQIQLVFSPANAHVPEAERNNRVLQERIRAAFHRLPYKALPKAILKILASESAVKLNFFPNKNGISPYYSPRQIVHRQTLDYATHCQYVLGSYVQAHDEPDPSNTQAPRTLDAIYLRPIAGGHEVYDLSTQRVITRRGLTVMPITQTVIDTVEAIAEAEGMKGLRIKTKRNVTLYDSSWTAGVDYVENANDDDESDDEDSDYEDESDEESTSDTSDTSGTTDSKEQFDQADEILYEEGDQQGHREQDAPREEVNNEIQEEPQVEEPQPRRSSRIPPPRVILQPSMKGQSHDKATLYQSGIDEEVEVEEYDRDIAQCACMLLEQFKCGMVKTITKHETKKKCFLVTYNLKKGIQKFGDKGYQAAKGEMKQLHDRDCWKPIHFHDMKDTEKKKALESLIFLVEKKSGKIKARHCANGSKQRQWMDKQDTASPTVSTNSVMITGTIEAEEGRDVATFDIPNAFIQTGVDEEDADGDRIVMKIRGAMIDMLLEIDREAYEPHVKYEHGQKVMYVHIQRAIYGMLMSGLLFYKKFRASIENIGYEVNPYDPCVANKTINGKQHTMSWHVDDLKSSHEDPKVNDDFQKWLQKEYGQLAEVTATRGKIHQYLGMTLDYSTPGELKVDMRDYVEDMIEDFPVKLKGTAKTPASDNLFQVEKAERLSPMKAEAFHTHVAKALFLTKRSRPDIALTVAFLCTRVQESNTSDWNKLIRMMDFLKRTKDDCLTLQSDGSRNVTWGVDAAFAVHPDSRSHSGFTMTMGKGAVISSSVKQKLNTRSSTEAELVAVDDAMAPIIWTLNFMEAQGYLVESHIILQDNESAIRLEKNGLKSVGARSRHINIKYFFITDVVKRGLVKIKYCPTDELEADYLTKPLQGWKCRTFRVVIMNL
jgi:hypothetical protein